MWRRLPCSLFLVLNGDWTSEPLPNTLPLMEQSISMLGLGKMGLPMANNLLAAGYALTVFNRTAEKAAGLIARGARLAESPGTAVIAGGIVVSMVSDDRALLAIADDAFCQKLGAGIHLSMSTVSADTNRILAERHARFGGQVVAAPVFGRPEAAVTRKLWIATSGPNAAKVQIKNLINALGQGVFDFGEEMGAANVVKLAGNILLATAIEAKVEATPERDEILSFIANSSRGIMKGYSKVREK